MGIELGDAFDALNALWEKSPHVEEFDFYNSAIDARMKDLVIEVFERAAAAL